MSLSWCLDFVWFEPEQELSMQEELVEGCISIGSGELAAVRQLAKLISSFCQKYPLVTYDLFTANADQVKEKMELFGSVGKA